MIYINFLLIFELVCGIFGVIYVLIFVCIMAINTYSELLTFKEKLILCLDDLISRDGISSSQYSVFFSYGSQNQRCKVWGNTDNKIDAIKKRLLNFIDKIFKKNKSLLELVKVDIAYNVEGISLQELKSNILGQRHNNQYRKGVSLDRNFNLCFLEQEMYGFSIINFEKSNVRNGITFNEPNYLDENKLVKAIKNKYQLEYKSKFKDSNTLWIFDTYAVYYEDGEFLSLISQGQGNGNRIIKVDKKKHILDLIVKNSKFLCDQINDDGSMVYGYFSVNDLKINNYNNVRHCTAIYSLLETFEVNRDDKYISKIKKSISYIVNNFCVKKNDKEFFIVDGSSSDYEIKLGANASAILMLTKYQEITGDDFYQRTAENLANGIIRSMVDNENNFIHVLSYPTFEIKDKFRIIYYDGEAVFSLLRLNRIIKNESLLDKIKEIVDVFVVKKYEKFHDHWLSYSVNELTMVAPDEKYFTLGINNYINHFKFLTERKTVNATFLEMLMSAYIMTSRINNEALIEKAKIKDLLALIEYRSDYQLTGFFYPEVAMYMKNPNKIINSFYSRPDRFRVRIDDQEHNLSGLIAYYNFFPLESIVK